MKKQIFTLTLVLIISATGFSQSFFSPLIGDLPSVVDARSLAVGLSIWGDAGSASALLTNSALLGLSKPKLSLIAGVNAFSIKEKRSFPVQDSFGDFLADNTYVLNQNWFPDFQIGINVKPLARIRFAALLNHANLSDFQYEEEVRGSLYGEYNRDPLVGYNRLSNRYSVFNTSLGMAVNPWKSLWLGAAVNFISPDFAEQKYEIQVIKTSDYQASKHTISYVVEPKFESAITGNFGMTLDITKHLSLATSYRLPYNNVQKGGLLYLVNDTTQTLPVLAIDSVFTIEKVTYRQPGELRFGLCLKPVNIIPTQLFFEIVYQNWEDASAKYQFRSDANPNDIPNNFSKTPIPYRNVTKIHFGIEHIFFSGVPLRLGFYHDPSPINAEMNRNWFTAGTGYQFGNFDLEISGAFTTGDYEYHDLFPIAIEKRVEFDTVRESYLVGMATFRYNF
ncbi:MAG TPA: hypothetical protein P5268_04865 [Candidatus Marinimicrobia bacterium]|nr:hypothetical protein [Candidatus Neomarinimicrobiota bacterium]HRS51572.1 hypothetical protein [Candidatus Neomarinimicrobiota bacterium]HRU92350.1 hypothetical protein [Candidatus Neomarinimicrobiota bacterium]